MPLYFPKWAQRLDCHPCGETRTQNLHLLPASSPTRGSRRGLQTGLGGGPRVRLQQDTGSARDRDICRHTAGQRRHLRGPSASWPALKGKSLGGSVSRQKGSAWFDLGPGTSNE